jgi:hypothetical protein
MRSILKKSAVFAVAFVVFNGATARAAGVEVKVAFPFVVHGQTLPAGQYLVERDEGSSAVLIRGMKGNHADTFVLTAPAAGHDPAGEKPALTFTRHESQYRLSSIWESGTDGYAIVER